ncbi:hypothetical protein EDC94DRAFT_619565 [Helicostylum pulchrum]|nr:hypothetical protein EDC94DRAFT_619565 [Helicostylum pulchrum]
MLFSSFAVLVVFHIAVLNAQTTTGNTTTVQPIDKPAGLPNVEWDILKIEPSSRDNLCQRQIAYCSNNCGGPNEAPKNFCNATTLAWGCGCSRKTPDFTPFLWPVVQAECSGKAQECQMICNTDKIHPSTCAATCNSYYQCGTDRAPPSYLQTESPSDAPSYNGPPKNFNGAANGSGDASDTTSISDSNSVHVTSLYFLVTFTTATILKWL